jgi:hypothetical protein
MYVRLSVEKGGCLAALSESGRMSGRPRGRKEYPLVNSGPFRIIRPSVGIPSRVLARSKDKAIEATENTDGIKLLQSTQGMQKPL